jgi:hypothetical protein
MFFMIRHFMINVQIQSCNCIWTLVISICVTMVIYYMTISITTQINSYLSCLTGYKSEIEMNMDKNNMYMYMHHE